MFIASCGVHTALYPSLFGPPPGHARALTHCGRAAPQAAAASLRSARAGACAASRSPLLCVAADAPKFDWVEAKTVKSLLNDKGATFIDLRTKQVSSACLTQTRTQIRLLGCVHGAETNTAKGRVLLHLLRARAGACYL